MDGRGGGGGVAEVAGNAQQSRQCSAVTTAEQTMQRMALTGAPAERRLYMECKWWERLWQAMQRVQNQALLDFGIHQCHLIS
jgi:hypothetical protein